MGPDPQFHVTSWFFDPGIIRIHVLLCPFRFYAFLFEFTVFSRLPCISFVALVPSGVLPVRVCITLPIMCGTRPFIQTSNEPKQIKLQHHQDNFDFPGNHNQNHLTTSFRQVSSKFGEKFVL